MTKAQLLAAALCLALAPQLAPAHGGGRWSVRLHFGAPYYSPRPWYPGYGYYYAPPPAVIYQPPPVVYAQPAVVQVPATVAAPVPVSAPVQAVPTSAVIQ